MLDNSFEECLQKLVNNFKCGLHITVVVPDLYYKNFIRLNSSCHSYTLRNYEPHTWYVHTDIYIIYYKEVTTGLTAWKIKYDTFWNPRAKHIIVISYETSDAKKTDIFRKLVKYKVYDAIVITQENGTLVTLTYYPLDFGNCGKKYKRIEKLEACTDNNQFYPISDFKECSITAVGSEYSLNYSFVNHITQYEQLVLNLSSEAIGIHLNYEFVDIDLNSGDTFPNHTSVGMLRYLQKRKSDIVYGGLYLSKNRIQSFDYVHGYKYSVMKVILPKISPKLWKIFYKPYELNLWLLNGFIYILLSCIIMIVARKCFYIRNISALPLKLLDYYFGHSDRGIFKLRPLRILLIFWILYTFCIANFYTSTLLSIIYCIRYPNFASNNLSELKEAGFKPCISDSTNYYFRFTYNVTLNDGQRPECRHTEDALKTTMKNYPTYFTVTGFASYGLTLFSNHKYAEVEYPSKIIYALYANKGFLFFKQFQNISIRIFESGLMNRHMHLFELQKSKMIQHEKQKQSRILSKEDLAITFIILMVGYAISFLVFIIEIIWQKFNRKSSRN
ncbi:unnamed protein product [Leptosia nina]|uniref:Ionotropic receptor n=1 Tax=Leptosia nina TaxID=320188 RepID=A0AAV1K6U3_9NEOP